MAARGVAFRRASESSRWFSLATASITRCDRCGVRASARAFSRNWSGVTLNRASTAARAVESTTFTESFRICCSESRVRDCSIVGAVPLGPRGIGWGGTGCSIRSSFTRRSAPITPTNVESLIPPLSLPSRWHPAASAGSIRQAVSRRSRRGRIRRRREECIGRRLLVGGGPVNPSWSGEKRWPVTPTEGVPDACQPGSSSCPTDTPIMAPVMHLHMSAEKLLEAEHPRRSHRGPTIPMPR